MRRWLWLLAAWLPAACAAPLPPACTSPPPAGSQTAWLVDQGWHTDIGLRAADLAGDLSRFRDIFPGTAVLMFGFGKRTWMTARVELPSEWLMGPFPGPGAIQLVALGIEPERAYRGNLVERLSLSPSQSARLQHFILQSIGRTRDGSSPRLISQGLFPGSLFYAASHHYDTLYTCNSWTADALQAAGLDVRPDGVVFAGGVLRQTARLRAACRLGS